ncbi:DUF1775 domain-containing protein [Paenibacillus albidus]|uniref:YcnI family copper-binding membrane protein n=1 Tax=Paenibacillus albidus TaxID=2041023 RepID=UPI001BE57D96|nr:DUF1775 domain-containing protein [Paenibacillus albidus]MBT2292630.1 DUF1775 domain-containing protein [Paenibacillus albidus]
MNNLLRKLITLLMPSAALLLLFTAVASAHVTVAPALSGTGAWETYTLKVPSEKDSATIQIDLRIPQGAEFKQYEPSPGWEVTIEGNKVSWKATGEGILAGQFQRFYFTAKNPDTAGDIAWDAYQHYADGSLVQWSGEEGTDTPHAVTEIVQSASGHDHSHGSMNMEEPVHEAGDAESSTSPAGYVALGVSILALLLSIVGLFRRRS